MPPPPLHLTDVEHALERAFIAAEGTELRKEDRKKAIEVHALLAEIERLVRARRKPVVLVDAAAGKAYLGLLAASLVLAPRGLEHTIHAVERDARRVIAARDAARALGLEDHFEAHASLVTPEALPLAPTVVAALHACGDASDAVIDAVIARDAAHLLLVPCCTAKSTRGASALSALEAERGVPRHGGVRRRLREVLVLSERVLRLEAAGYATEVVDFVPETVTPYNVLLRARRVHEAVRMAEARDSLARLTRA